MIFLESGYAENAETNDPALLIHPLHQRIASSRPHVTGRVRKGHFEIITLTVKPQFTLSTMMFLRTEGAGEHSGPSNHIPCRCAALQINSHDHSNRVPSIDRDGEAYASLSPARSHGSSSRWSAALAEHPRGWVPSPASATPKARADKNHMDGLCQGEKWSRNARPHLLPLAAVSGSFPLQRSCGPDLAAQCATYQFREAHLLTSRLIEQELLDLSREPERYRHTAFWQLRSGHEAMCIIVSYTMSTLNFLAVSYSL
ncbi:MAG: hypothetical protein V7609_2729 [Verrucomicrobiota bacterium]